MTVKYLGNNQYQGLAADTKPTNAAVIAQFYETDTGKLYRYNGTSWRPEYIKNPASMIVFKDGTTYYAQEADGTIVSSSTTDASIPIAYAINNIPGAAARGYGGRVFMFAGDYDCKTEIAADISTTTYHAVEIEGEGKATRLNFTPSGALTNGIRLKMSRPRLAHMAIYGNSNVTNLVRVTGTAGIRSDSGIVEGIEFRGANTTAGIDTMVAPVANQVGLFREGAAAANANFYWRIDNCDFRSLDIGAYAKDIFSTSSMWTGLNFYGCTTGLKLSTGEHNITNVYGSGGTYGRYLIHCASDGGGQNVGTNNSITNAIGEFYAPGLECATVLIDSGVSNVRMQNVSANAGEPPYNHEFHFRVLDKNISRINLDFDRGFIPNPSQMQARVGAWCPGHTALGKEMGTLAGNVLHSGPVPFFAGSLNGPTAIIGTGATINTVTSYRYNNANPNGGNYIRRANNPRMNVRFIPEQTANVRYFFGLWDNTTAAPTTTADMLNGRKGVGIWVDTAVTGQWKVMHNDGTGASTLTAIAGNPTISIAEHRVYVIIYQHTTNAITGPITPVTKANVIIDNILTTVTTDLPPNAADNLGFLISLENTTGAGRSCQIFDIEQSTDQ